MTEPQQAISAQADQAQAANEQPVARQATTAWTSSGRTPLRQFLRTETGSATILVGATLAALIWSNVASGSYEAFWATRLTAGVGGHGITHGPARVRELGADDAVLPGSRPRGAPRVGHGRAAGAQPGGAAVPCRARRHARPDRDLLRLQRRAADRARLGRRDVHRHRVRARRARPGRRQQAARPGAHLPADLLGRRRPGRDRGHRHLLQQPRALAPAAHRRRAARGRRLPDQARRPQRPGLPARSGSPPGWRSGSRASTRSSPGWSSAC